MGDVDDLLNGPRLEADPAVVGWLAFAMLGGDVKPRGSRRPRLRALGPRVRSVARFVERLDDATQVLAGVHVDELRGGKPLGLLADGIERHADRLDGGIVYRHGFIPVTGSGFSYRGGDLATGL